MITNITLEYEDGRLYALVTRDSIIEGETIAIYPTETAETYYTKYLPNMGDVVKVDITPYCVAALGSIRGIYNNMPSKTFLNGSAGGTVVYPGVNGYRWSRAFYRNRNSRHNDIPLTKLPYIQVSERNGGYSIPIALKVEDDTFGSIDFGDSSVRLETNGSEDIKYILLQSSTLPASLAIEDSTNVTETIIPVRAIARGMNTRRLVWLNEVGGIDSWYFEYLRETSIATTSEVFYSSLNGYTRVGRISEVAHTIETRELDDITAAVVAYIIASPEVYMEDERGDLTPIDIITDQCRIYSDSELSSIQVVYRNKKRSL